MKKSRRPPGRLLLWKARARAQAGEGKASGPVCRGRGRRCAGTHSRPALGVRRAPVIRGPTFECAVFAALVVHGPPSCRIARRVARPLHGADTPPHRAPVVRPTGLSSSRWVQSLTRHEQPRTTRSKMPSSLVAVPVPLRALRHSSGLGRPCARRRPPRPPLVPPVAMLGFPLTVWGVLPPFFSLWARLLSCLRC